MIQFLHGFEDVSIERARADTTVLDYLREHRAMVGTKEGCASGDCGACSAVVVKADSESLSYAPVNTCIATLGSLHGCQLITVEQLQDGETWHPVQRAMIEAHASQCGFCTPGFVMSLFALFHSDETPSREVILEALGGNLCRCTGYRPIIDAAYVALSGARTDQYTERATETHSRLAAFSRAAPPPESMASLIDDSGMYYRPESASDLAVLLAEHSDARLIAGGTDLLLEKTQFLKALPKLIDVTAVTDLAAIESTEKHFRIGAAVTHRQAAAALQADYPELEELIERFGSRQIRSQGTVVGNIANASPIGDWPPVLLALGATLELASAAGSRSISVDDFFIDYRKTSLAEGEFIASVTLPRRDRKLFLRAYKISKRFEDDISSVCAVAALMMEGDDVVSAKLAFGGMAAVPKRASTCEAALIGKELNESAIDEAMAALEGDFGPITDARASAQYRSRVAGNLLKRLQLEFTGSAATRVHAHAQGASRG
ncbi:MAG: xanthine dehydrogenase small subunit [Pseudomonadota bacterium]